MTVFWDWTSFKCMEVASLEVGIASPMALELLDALKIKKEDIDATLAVVTATWSTFPKTRHSRGFIIFIFRKLCRIILSNMSMCEGDTIIRWILIILSCSFGCDFPLFAQFLLSSDGIVLLQPSHCQTLAVCRNGCFLPLEPLHQGQSKEIGGSWCWFRHDRCWSCCNVLRNCRILTSWSRPRTLLNRWRWLCHVVATVWEENTDVGASQKAHVLPGCGISSYHLCTAPPKGCSSKFHGNGQGVAQCIGWYNSCRHLGWTASHSSCSETPQWTDGAVVGGQKDALGHAWCYCQESHAHFLCSEVSHGKQSSWCCLAYRVGDCNHRCYLCDHSPVFITIPHSSSLIVPHLEPQAGILNDLLVAKATIDQSCCQGGYTVLHLGKSNFEIMLLIVSLEQTEPGGSCTMKKHQTDAEKTAKTATEIHGCFTVSLRGFPSIQILTLKNDEKCLLYQTCIKLFAFVRGTLNRPSVLCSSGMWPRDVVTLQYCSNF